MVRPRIVQSSIWVGIILLFNDPLDAGQRLFSTFVINEKAALVQMEVEFDGERFTLPFQHARQ